MNDLDEKVITETDFLSNFLDNLDPPLEDRTPDDLRALSVAAPQELKGMLVALAEFKEKELSALATADRIARAAHHEWVEHAERMLIEYFWGG